jgi:hypothetical protein
MDVGRIGADRTPPLTALEPPAIDARALVRKAVGGLADKAVRGFMTDETIELLRRECPGWDLHTLHRAFET